MADSINKGSREAEAGWPLGHGEVSEPAGGENLVRVVCNLMILFMVLVSACSQEAEDPSQGTIGEMTKTFGEDLEFLKKHVEVVLLSDPSGDMQVAVVPQWQGRVMTSTALGPEGPSFGWINYELIESGEILPHINVFGGEDRFWLGPEGGQYSIFFKENDPFDLDHWQTPAFIDTESYEITGREADEVSFGANAVLTNYSGTEFQIQVDRTVRILQNSDAQDVLGKEIPESVRMVAYESENMVTNQGEEAWTKENGLLSIWILGMFVPSADTTAIIPFVAGPVDELGPIVNDAYFGKIPEDRLRQEAGILYYKADGNQRGKLGISALRARDVLGSWDASGEVLTVVQFTKPDQVVDYVNSMWEIQEEPYMGDVVNSYNDGPPEPGAKALGPFYELETSSPAAALKAGESIVHVHRTFHFVGPRNALGKLSEDILGSTLEQAEAW